MTNENNKNEPTLKSTVDGINNRICSVEGRICKLEENLSKMRKIELKIKNSRISL